MPEGHTLHRLARRQQRVFGGAPVRVSSPQGRFVEGAADVDGMVFAKAEAWGKHLIQHFRPVGTTARTGRRMIHVHLGLYGSFTEAPAPLPPPVGQVRLRIEGHQVGTDLRGPTACELFTAADLDDLIARLGPDPLRRDVDPARMLAAIARSRRPIGALLMDQKVIAGIGNVYRAEVLFRARIDPYREGRSLPGADVAAIWEDLVALMRIGVRRGRIHVVRAEDDHGPGSYAPDRPRTYVYRRAGDPCRICATTVRTAEMDGRNLYWCPNCQV
ncbi:Fpg/Nei family DNA glycosylase [Gordonia sp. HNM0687]|uniref:DNA-(apurinic or apyrimidinic site) lyase n=1 Tax=Gordonia mangrovi TaxID=2665643 RepID=A0A6L7GSJ0_9ACTN|nr:Fpg/Nei family DNA glycosylase [Gordonia mangrovi]MXP22543.1 Fpg/Nei family DNA glycosylase [Gordonia mangrovi]UVF77585.1 Fpg/Nei family DNA glycosylase [Gordonia mangrovi]